jgi:hypothetical protein
VNVVDRGGREAGEAAAAAIRTERGDAADEVPAGDPELDALVHAAPGPDVDERDRDVRAAAAVQHGRLVPDGEPVFRNGAPRHLVPPCVDDAHVGEAVARMAEHRAIGLERHTSRGDGRRQLTRVAELVLLNAGRDRRGRDDRDELHARPPTSCRMRW